MQTTMELLDKALTERELTTSQWCNELGVNRTALHVARARGRLSPTMAGNLARLLGEEPKDWIAIAALEAEPQSYAKSKLISMAKEWGRKASKTVLFYRLKKGTENRSIFGYPNMPRTL